MWELYERRRIGRRIQRLPGETLKRYEKWKDIVIISGPAGLRAVKGFTTRPSGVNGQGTGLPGSGIGTG